MIRRSFFYKWLIISKRREWNEGDNQHNHGPMFEIIDQSTLRMESRKVIGTLTHKRAEFGRKQLRYSLVYTLVSHYEGFSVWSSDTKSSSTVEKGALGSSSVLLMTGCQYELRLPFRNEWNALAVRLQAGAVSSIMFHSFFSFHV